MAEARLLVVEGTRLFFVRNEMQPPRADAAKRFSKDPATARRFERIRIPGLPLDGIRSKFQYLRGQFELTGFSFTSAFHATNHVLSSMPLNRSSHFCSHRSHSSNPILAAVAACLLALPLLQSCSGSSDASSRESLEASYEKDREALRGEIAMARVHLDTVRQYVETVPLRASRAVDEVQIYAEQIDQNASEAIEVLDGLASAVDPASRGSAHLTGAVEMPGYLHSDALALIGKEADDVVNGLEQMWEMVEQLDLQGYTTFRKEIADLKTTLTERIAAIRVRTDAMRTTAEAYVGEEGS